jgi:hypothetical protein
VWVSGAGACRDFLARAIANDLSVAMETAFVSNPQSLSLAST